MVLHLVGIYEYAELWPSLQYIIFEYMFKLSKVKQVSLVRVNFFVSHDPLISYLNMVGCRTRLQKQLIFPLFRFCSTIKKHPIKGIPGKGLIMLFLIPQYFYNPSPKMLLYSCKAKLKNYVERSNCALCLFAFIFEHQKVADICSFSCCG